MADQVVLEVARRMYAQAELRPDGTRVFRGSPRSLMEQLGSSSGPRYRSLYRLGFERIGRGPNAQWLVPRQCREELGPRAGHEFDG